MNQIANLPPNVESVLHTFVEKAKSELGHDLSSVVLYGSAAEGKLRATSDVNLILVLKQFDAAKIDLIRENFRTAHAAIKLTSMFILEAELAAATEAFAVKFADIVERHVIVYGSDPFAQLQVPRSARINRLKQVLLNLMMRMRERYTLVSLREEQLAIVVAEMSGPVRSCALTLLALQGHEIHSPKDALIRFTSTSSPQLLPSVERLSLAREHRDFKSGEASKTLLDLLDVTGQMYQQSKNLA